MFSWVLLIPSSMYALDSTTITAAAARVKPTPTRARLCAGYRGPAAIARLAFATTASVRTRSPTIFHVVSSFAGLAPCIR